MANVLLRCVRSFLDRIIVEEGHGLQSRSDLGWLVAETVIAAHKCINQYQYRVL